MANYDLNKITIFGDVVELKNLYNLLNTKVEDADRKEEYLVNSVYYFYSKGGYDLEYLKKYFNNDFRFLIEKVEIRNNVIEIEAYNSYGCGIDYIVKLLEKFPKLNYAALIFDYTNDDYYKFDVNETFYKERYYLNYLLYKDDEEIYAEKLFTSLDDALNHFNYIFGTEIQSYDDVLSIINDVYEKPEKYDFTECGHISFSKIDNIVEESNINQLLKKYFEKDFVGRIGKDLINYLKENDQKSYKKLLNDRTHELNSNNGNICMVTLPIYAAKKLDKKIELIDYFVENKQQGNACDMCKFYDYIQQFHYNKNVTILIGNDNFTFQDIITYFLQEKFNTANIEILPMVQYANGEYSELCFYIRKGKFERKNIEYKLSIKNQYSIFHGLYNLAEMFYNSELDKIFDLLYITME